MNGAIDRLQGLKENVIIGRLIPARLDISTEGRERLGLSLRMHDAPSLAALENDGHEDRKEESLDYDAELEDFDLTLR